MLRLFGKNATIEQAADRFVDTMATRVDEYYPHYRKGIVEALSYCGMSHDDSVAFDANPSTKWALLVGMYAQELLAAKNVFGQVGGARFISAALHELNRFRKPSGDDIETLVCKLLAINERYIRPDAQFSLPLAVTIMNVSYYNTVRFMLVGNDMYHRPFRKKLGSDFVAMEEISHTFTSGFAGVVEETAKANGF